jgi:rusticyanin
MRSTRLAAVIGSAVITAAGLAALAGCGTATKAPAGTASPAYSYYQTTMKRLYSGGTMMGGQDAPSWMMGRTGYRRMMGGQHAPSWMRGQALPGFMMGTSQDPATIMGSLWANAPGLRVSSALAGRLGNRAPAGAVLDRAANRITFTGSTARLVVLASPPGGPDETFRIAGLTDPAIVVKPGARISIEVINADPDTAHGLVVTSGAGSSRLPMMTTQPAFPGSAVWFLGDPTAAGMHAATLSFTASTPGTYRYLCPVPGHARDGMVGAFTVS